MPRLRLVPIGLLASLTLAACVGSGPGASPSPPPTPSPSPSPAISHATGPTDVILRMSTGGGFVAPGTLVTEIPEYSLYGDGTVVFRDPATSYIEPTRPDGIGLRVPFETAHLTESQVQAILADAIGPGGLGAARGTYAPSGIADAPSTIFTIRAGGLDKLVTVGALGFDQPAEAPEAAARAAFAALAKRLITPDLRGAVATAYEPTAYRGVLSEAADGQPAVSPIPWPWTAFGPADFTASGPTGLPVPTRALTAADVAALEIDGVQGGATGIALGTTDGKVYLLSLRPLLPDERS